jgi:hypothetical protein
LAECLTNMAMCIRIRRAVFRASVLDAKGREQEEMCTNCKIGIERERELSSSRKELCIECFSKPPSKDSSLCKGCEIRNSASRRRTVGDHCRVCDKPVRATMREPVCPQCRADRPPEVHYRKRFNYCKRRHKMTKVNTLTVVKRGGKETRYCKQCLKLLKQRIVVQYWQMRRRDRNADGEVQPQA